MRRNIAADNDNLFGVWHARKIFMDGENITDEIVKDFGGVDKWLLRLVAAFNDLRIKAFAISRVGGVVKLYVRSVY